MTPLAKKKLIKKKTKSRYPLSPGKQKLSKKGNKIIPHRVLRTDGVCGLKRKHCKL